LPEGLREAEKLRAAIRDSLGKMRQAGRAHLNPQEPEARLMPCEGRTGPAYNAQAVADAEAQIVVAAEVVNEEADNAQLIPMLEAVEANLGKVAETTVADGGYVSGEQLQEAEARGQGVVVAAGGETGGPKRGEYHSTMFTYNEAADEVVCPRGERLRFEGMVNKGGEREVRRYRCQSYEQCPVRALCSQRRDGRRIEISPQYGALQRQRDKRQDPRYKALMRQRSGLIEPVFASIKQALGFRRWTVRGLDNVRAQWALLCTAHNLKKLYQHWAESRRPKKENSRPQGGRVLLRCLAAAIESLMALEQRQLGLRSQRAPLLASSPIRA